MLDLIKFILNLSADLIGSEFMYDSLLLIFACIIFLIFLSVIRK